MQTPSSLYGVLAEFGTPDELLAATHRAREARYQQMDAYTPFPLEGLAEALRKTEVELAEPWPAAIWAS